MSKSRLQPVRRGPPGAQAGVTLIEALVALLIMAFGMVAMIGIQSNMRTSADLARQRSEAVRLAQQDIEQLRAFASLTLADGAPEQARAYSQIAEDSASNAGDGSSNTQFALTRTVQTADSQSDVKVTVTWLDRSNGNVDAPNSVSLRSFITRADPKLAASLSIAPDGLPARRPQARDPSIPVKAKDVGSNRSIYKPPNSGGIAWVFDNLTGLIVSRCSGLSDSASNADFSASTLSLYCNNNVAALPVSGFVRFSLATPPDSDYPGSDALPLDLVFSLTSTGHPDPAFECSDDAPATAVSNRPDGVSYFCAVYPGSTGSWSGQLLLNGLALGDGGYRVCRYSADYDGNGKRDNAEHPSAYSAVTAALTAQNFLVVRAAASCPAGHAKDIDQGYFFNSATESHQP